MAAKRRKASQKPARRRKAPHKPTTPTSWDMGPDTPAQRAGKVVEPASYADPDTGKEINPNGVKRLRRVDLVEVYYRRGWISKRGFAAADALRKAYEGTQRSPPAINPVQVDTSPKPDQNVAIQIDRMSRYVALMGLVNTDHHRLVAAVVLEDMTPAHAGWKGKRYQEGVKLLAEALDVLADRMENRRG